MMYEQFAPSRRIAKVVLLAAAVCAWPSAEAAPEVEICKLVRIADSDSFSDADDITGDVCDFFAQEIPSGAVGLNATYRLYVFNTGDEILVNPLSDSEGPVISDAALGIVSVPVPGGPMAPNDVRVIDFDDASNAFQVLFYPDRCAGTPGNKDNVATVAATGQDSRIDVSDGDVARVTCTGGPAIELRKQVRLTVDGPFADADTPAGGPTGGPGADAEYRLIVKNIGTETLTNIQVTDGTLGLAQAVPGTLAPGDERTLSMVDPGFSALFVDNRCDAAGIFMNTAAVTASAETSGTAVEAADAAYLTCEKPQILIKKQVSLTGGEPFFDADAPQDAPVGIVGTADATYRLIVENVGTETLVGGVVSDRALGMENVSIGGPLRPGEQRTLDAGPLADGKIPALFLRDRCEGTPGSKPNTARVDAVGEVTGTSVTAADAANVLCVDAPEPRVSIRTQVSLDNEDWRDADKENGPDVPGGLVVSDAYYRYVVENTGGQILVNPDDSREGPVVDDPELGINKVPVPGGPMAPGDVRIIQFHDAGFGRLFSQSRCDSVGNKYNIASVTGQATVTGQVVTDDDPANIDCAQPQVCTITVDQQCVPPPPPPAEDLLCEAAIKSTVLRYTGPDRSGVTVRFEGDKNGDVTYHNVDLVSGVTILTMAGQNDSTIDAASVGGDALGSKTYVYVDDVLEEIIHTSCSAVYAAGAPAPLDSRTPNPPGSRKGDPSANWFVVSFEDKDGEVVSEPAGTARGADVCHVMPSAPGAAVDVGYTYKVTNTGATTVDVTSVLDAPLGELLAAPEAMLEPGDEILVTAAAPVAETTESQVLVTANVSGNAGARCVAKDSVRVTVSATSGGAVTAVKGPELKDDEFKWKLENTGEVDAFITEVEVSWPAAQGRIKKLELDGTFFDGASLAPSRATLRLSDFVSKPKKRRLKPGKAKDFKIRFDGKSSRDIVSDYEVKITFDNGQVVTLP